MAAGVLRRAPRSAADLAERLVAKGYQVETAAKTVARSTELGWVNDAQLALDRARTLRRRGAGSLRIAADLEARGVATALIDAAVAESRGGESEAVWARRALGHARAADPPRAWRLLLSRGFPEEVVADVVPLPDSGH
ncbi:MAG: regulatory protein RecX [bacterium]|nr:regulatory protein RecX [bacterium]